MDFQKYIDGFFSTACVLSVEKKDNGYGDIRIVAGNSKFIAMAEKPPYITDPNIPLSKFEPNSIYYRYLPRTPDFEDKCFRSAILKNPIHTYIHLNVCNLWFNMFFLPVDCDEGDLSYCVYATEPAAVNDIDMSSSSSMTTSNDVLRTCIKLRGTNDLRVTMNEVIKDIRELCGAEVCTLLIVDQDKATSTIFATSKAENSTIHTLSQKKNMYDVAMSWLDTIGERDCIIVRNGKDLEYVKSVNPLWHQTLIDSNVQSIVVFPLRHNRELLGFIWATNFNIDSAQRIKETLELTTFFISSEIASYMMFNQLKHISYTDLLTGINNRNAMNNRVMRIVSGEENIKQPYGIVFADLNGLKKVNDEGGHSAGDLLLKKAGLLLQEIFTEDEIYRAGGDEFMVIVPGTSEEDFEHKIEELRKRSSDPDNVCFAVGSMYNGTDTDIRDIMRKADERMYRDKDQYYSDHPDRKYR